MFRKTQKSLVRLYILALTSSNPFRCSNFRCFNWYSNDKRWQLYIRCSGLGLFAGVGMGRYIQRWIRDWVSLENTKYLVPQAYMTKRNIFKKSTGHRWSKNDMPWSVLSLSGFLWGRDIFVGGTETASKIYFWFAFDICFR